MKIHSLNYFITFACVVILAPKEINADTDVSQTISNLINRQCDACQEWDEMRLDYQNDNDRKKRETTGNSDEESDQISEIEREPRKKGGSGGSRGSSSSSKGYSGSKYKGSSSSSSGSKVSKYVSKISSTGKVLMAHALWKSTTSKSYGSKYKWGKSKKYKSYDDWEEDAMEQRAYIDDNGNCHCNSYVFKAMLGLIFALAALVY